MVNTTSAFRFSFPPLVPLLLLPLLLPIILFRLGLLHHEDFAWRLSDNGHSLIQYLYFFSHTPPDPRVGNDDTIRGANVGSTPTLTSFTSPIPSTRLRPRSFRVYGVMGSLLPSVPPSPGFVLLIVNSSANIPRAAAGFPWRLMQSWK